MTQKEGFPGMGTNSSHKDSLCFHVLVSMAEVALRPGAYSLVRETLSEHNHTSQYLITIAMDAVKKATWEAGGPSSRP